MRVSPLAELTRGGHAESIHFGSIAIVNLKGEVLWHAGDPHFMTFTRSTLKPFQCMPFVAENGPAQCGYGQQDLALMCASHSGEPMHIGIVHPCCSESGVTNLNCSVVAIPLISCCTDDIAQ